jgi:hypothetical protein
MFKKTLFCVILPIILLVSVFSINAKALTDTIDPSEADVFYHCLAGRFDDIVNLQIIYSLDESPDFLLAEFSPYGYSIALRGDKTKISESAINLGTSSSPYAVYLPLLNGNIN